MLVFTAISEICTACWLVTMQVQYTKRLPIPHLIFSSWNLSVTLDINNNKYNNDNDNNTEIKNPEVFARKQKETIKYEI